MNDNQSLSALGPADSPRRILVVDDDPPLRLLSAAVLVRAGYHVDAAEDGAAGWKALQAEEYDLLITDNSMPKVTGVELLKMLRSARMTIPVIMATGILPKDEFTRSPELQPSATLLKPFAVDALLEVVKNVLRAADTPGEQIDPQPTDQYGVNTP